MSGKPDDPIVIEGTIKKIHLSAFGPNSGELTLVLRLPKGETRNVYAGIIDIHRDPDSIEHGSFAGYVNLATLAYMTKATVRCSYLMRKGKERINGLTIETTGI